MPRIFIFPTGGKDNGPACVMTDDGRIICSRWIEDGVSIADTFGAADGNLRLGTDA